MDKGLLDSATIHGDVNTLIPKKTYDLTSLSFPCKGLSVAGKGEGTSVGY